MKITCTFDDTTHKVVPIEPSPKMVDATFNDDLSRMSHNERNKHIYGVMIAAAAPPYPESNFVESLDSWISVDDRLPEMNLPVLTSSEFGVTAHCRVDLGDGNWGWGVPQYSNLSDCRNYECDDDYAINFWMNFPEAPKGE